MTKKGRKTLYFIAWANRWNPCTMLGFLKQRHSLENAESICACRNAIRKGEYYWPVLCPDDLYTAKAPLPSDSLKEVGLAF